ncbi:L-asparaginase/Glu-tRNA(Gln) amidotransferase subunit D [Flavobacterium sp. 7A]|nr:L-asparaginase/Glu-tRNA(Gln) amidotransferase subunit D [Flavobacterium sp. 7A]
MGYFGFDNRNNYAKFDGFVVLHVSDTMVYTASALSFMFENLAKPIIFTGLQLPIGDLRTDTKENLITVIQISSLRENGLPVVQELCLFFEYKFYRGNRTTKVNAEHFQAFNSPNYPCLVKSGVHLKWNAQLLLPSVSNNELLKVQYTLDTNVVIIKLFPGISQTVVTAIFAIPTLRGGALETYGSGNAITVDWFVQLMQEVIQKGMYVINVTQCSVGSVQMGHCEISIK